MAGVSLADVPKLVSFQGRLTDEAGAPVPDGNYDLTFRLYSAETGGAPLWTEIQTGVSVTGGLYLLQLGSVTPLAAVHFNQQLWLGLAVATDAEMVPRYRLASAPSALAIPDTLDQLSVSTLGILPQSPAPPVTRGCSILTRPRVNYSIIMAPNGFRPAASGLAKRVPRGCPGRTA